MQVTLCHFTRSLKALIFWDCFVASPLLDTSQKQQKSLMRTNSFKNYKIIRKITIFGAMTFSKMAFSITTFSTTINNSRHSIMALRITSLDQECYHAQCHLCWMTFMLSVTNRLSVVMLNAIMLRVIVLKVVMLSVIMLKVVMLSVIMLNVVILSVIILSIRVRNFYYLSFVIHSVPLTLPFFEGSSLFLSFKRATLVQISNIFLKWMSCR